MKDKYFDINYSIKGITLTKQQPKMSNNNGFIPVFPIGIPNTGIPALPPPITQDTPVYSAYTTNLIGYGPIPWGTPNDAPVGNKQHGGIYHGIVYNPCNNSYMAHYCPPSKGPYMGHNSPPSRR